MIQTIAFWLLIVLYALVFFGAFALHNKPREGKYEAGTIIFVQLAIALLWLVATGQTK